MNWKIVWLARLLATIIVTSFAVLVAYASIPIHDENGCTIGSRGASAYGYTEDTKINIPWYLTTGDRDSSTFIVHPYDHPEIDCPPIHHARIEILLPFTGKLVGHLEYAFSDVYITVPTSDEVKYFPTRDVFVESTQEWNFKEFRK